MLITSRFDGVCTACGREVRAGDRVSWTRGVRGVLHAACSPEGRELLAKLEASRVAELAAEPPASGEHPTAAAAPARPIPCPEDLDYLPFQWAGIPVLVARLSTHSGALLADEQGLGKSIQAIGVVSAMPELSRILVVCPNSVKLNWKNEWLKWFVGGATVRVHLAGRKKPKLFLGGDDPLGRQVTVDVVNYQSLKMLDRVSEQDPVLAGLEEVLSRWDLAIVDEAQAYKNPNAARTKAFRALARARVGKVLVMTGTPIENRPSELFPLLSMFDAATWDPAGRKKVKGQWVDLKEGEGAGFWNFAKRYCDAKKVWLGRTSHWDFSGASNLAELQERLRAGGMVRRLKRDVLRDLPEKIRSLVPIGECEDPDYDARDCDLEEVEKRVAKIPFTQLSAARHAQGLQKVEGAVEYVAAKLEGGDTKVIVFAHHLDVIEGLREGLKEYGVVTIAGDTKVEERQAAVEAFQAEGGPRVFLGALKAAGTGLTLTRASRVVFVERSWNPADMVQAEDRAHRIGQTRALSVDILTLEGSLDARMQELLMSKIRVAELALDAGSERYDVEGRPVVETPTEKRMRRLREVSLTEEQVERAHAALRFLAGRCDGARELDGAGFNRLDTQFGKELAAQAALSPAQALAALKVLKKYRGQLGERAEGLS